MIRTEGIVDTVRDGDTEETAAESRVQAGDSLGLDGTSDSLGDGLFVSYLLSCLSIIERE